MAVSSERVTMNQEQSLMLQRDTLPVRVLNVLMDWIMDGELKMGDKLNTEELARQLGVSRMPIREALNSLEKMGLAESVPYVGTRLVTLNQDDILEIYLMRQKLEPLLAEEACKKATKEEIEKIEKIHQEYIELVSEAKLKAKEIHLLNRKFHFAIYSTSDLKRVCSVVESLWDTLSFFKLIYGREFINDSEKVSNMIAEHYSYIECMKKRDGEKFVENLVGNLQNRISNISQNKDYYMI